MSETPQFFEIDVENALQEISRTLDETSLPLLDQESRYPKNAVIVLSGILILYNLKFISMIGQRISFLGADFEIRSDVLKYLVLFILTFFFVSFLLACYRSGMKWRVRRDLLVRKIERISSDQLAQLNEIGASIAKIQEDGEEAEMRSRIFDGKSTKVQELLKNIKDHIIIAIRNWDNAPTTQFDEVLKQKGKSPSSSLKFFKLKPPLYPFIEEEIRPLFLIDMLPLTKDECFELYKSLEEALNAKVDEAPYAESVHLIATQVFHSFERSLRPDMLSAADRIANRLNDFRKGLTRAEHAFFIARRSGRYFTFSLNTAFVWEFFVPTALYISAAYTSLLLFR